MIPQLIKDPARFVFAMVLASVYTYFILATGIFDYIFEWFMFEIFPEDFIFYIRGIVIFSNFVFMYGLTYWITQKIEDRMENRFSLDRDLAELDLDLDDLVDDLDLSDDLEIEDETDLETFVNWLQGFNDDRIYTNYQDTDSITVTRANRYQPPLKKGSWGIKCTVESAFNRLREDKRYKLHAIKFTNQFNNMRKEYSVLEVMSLKLATDRDNWITGYYKDQYNFDLPEFKFVLKLKLTGKSTHFNILMNDDWMLKADYPDSVIDSVFLIPQSILTKIKEEKRKCLSCKKELKKSNNKYCDNCYKYSKKVVDDEKNV